MKNFKVELFALVSLVEFIYMGKTKVSSPLIQQASMAAINSLGKLSSTIYKLEENITSNEAEDGKIIEGDESEKERMRKFRLNGK